MSIRYELYVEGKSWGGPEASYTYPLKRPITCASDAAKIAGDFESLSYWQCYSIEETRVIKSISGSFGDEAKQFSIPEISLWMDEAEYIKANDLISTAASLDGDGQGAELGGNTEYERGMAELISRYMGWSGDLIGEICDAIHAYAKDNAQRAAPVRVTVILTPSA